MSIMLDHPVLVLSSPGRGMKPVDVVTLEKAIGMATNTYKSGEPKAELFDPSNFQRLTWADWAKLEIEPGEKVVRSAHAQYKVPDIIVLTRREKIPRRGQDGIFNRRGIYDRDNNTCQYCGKRFSSSDLSIEHVNPRRLGGTSTWENCVLACIPCNLRKGGRTPEQAGMKLLNKPVKPKVQLNFPYKRYKCKTWETFLGEQYWTVELEP